MFKNLDAIKGVGDRIKSLLMDYYGSESAALGTLFNFEFEGLINAGVSLEKAMEIARSLAAENYGFNYSKILKNREAKDLLTQILTVIKSYPRTDHGRVAVGIFYPTLDRKELLRRRDYVRDCVGVVNKLKHKRDELNNLLKQISSLKEEEPRIKDIIALEDEELYQKVTSVFKKKGNFILIESADDLEHIRDFEFVRYVQANARFSDRAMELPNVEPVYGDELNLIVPELVISFFESNRECILSAIKIAKLTGYRDLVDMANLLEPDIEAIKFAENGGISKSSDPELEKLSLAEQDLESVLQKSLEKANYKISEKIREMSIKGEEILDMLRTSDNSTLLGILPKEFYNLILTTVREQEELSAETLGIGKGLLRGAFSTDTYPLQIDSEWLLQIKLRLLMETKAHELKVKQLIAEKLSKHSIVAKKLVREVMELDLKLAIGWFYLDHFLSHPKVQPELGVGFQEGRNLLLTGVVQPVGYVIGASELFPKHNERAVVITGANSGGKTTLLELVAQICIMTQMGIGVPAGSVTCFLFDEIYYFRKGQTSNAGAFESLLKTFEGVSSPAKTRLILADEIEAITEPGAAAKILAALLDWFKEEKGTLIAVVTHLGEDIKKQVGKGVRIDGIEARGLDEELNLVADRNPVLGKAAKSTPELIVERLGKISSNKEFYERILKRFRD
jgi:hypothetical protein